MPRPVWVLVLLAALAAPAAAQSQSFRTHYMVTYLGFPVAKARFDATFAGDRFSVEGTLASAGLARLIDNTTGTTRVEGAIRKDSVSPESYVLEYESDGKKGHTSVRFSGGDVADAVNKPGSRRGDTWIPVPPDQLKAALDPISSILIRAAGPAEVCNNRTIRVFDGELRADITLTHRYTGPIAGFSGQAVTCNARFVPIAGYRSDKRQIRQMKDKGKMVISFMRLGDSGFYTPVDAIVTTGSGTLRVTASRIEAR